jgi:hypothetical protein
MLKVWHFAPKHGLQCRTAEVRTVVNVILYKITHARAYLTPSTHTQARTYFRYRYAYITRDLTTEIGRKILELIEMTNIDLICREIETATTACKFLLTRILCRLKKLYAHIRL